jgi:hypothetical protein
MYERDIDNTLPAMRNMMIFASIIVAAIIGYVIYVLIKNYKENRERQDMIDKRNRSEEDYVPRRRTDGIFDPNDPNSPLHIFHF